VLYLDRRGRLKVRIHGRPRSDRKRSFLLSAVAPSTSTRHPREARPINWAQRGGLASGGESSPDAEATFHCASCTLGNPVVAASDGPPFRQESRPTRLCRTPGAGSVLPLSRALAVIKRVTRAFVSWTVFSTRPRDRCSPCFPWEQICGAGSILERFRVLRDAESVNTRSVRSLSTRHA
jgi:hypothetical protein